LAEKNSFALAQISVDYKYFFFIIIIIIIIIYCNWVFIRWQYSLHK